MTEQQHIADGDRIRGAAWLAPAYYARCSCKWTCEHNHRTLRAADKCADKHEKDANRAARD